MTNRKSRPDNLVRSGAENGFEYLEDPMGPRGGLDPDELPPTPQEGRRYVGFCRDCRDFVELSGDFSCKRAGHSRSRIAVALDVPAEEPLPHMPSMNWGALFMPALWGPLHGQWYMIMFYPLWLMLDNLIYASVHGEGIIWLTVIACILCAAFTIYYGLKANSWGYPRVASEKTLEEYLKRERVIAIALVALGVAFLVFATYYNLAVRPFA